MKSEAYISKVKTEAQSEGTFEQRNTVLRKGE